MTAEKEIQNDSGISIREVEALRITVKKVIKNHVERTIIKGLYHFCAPKELPNITGRTGRTHGARTLNTPAINARTHKDIQNRKKG